MRAPSLWGSATHHGGQHDEDVDPHVRQNFLHLRGEMLVVTVSSSCLAGGEPHLTAVVPGHGLTETAPHHLLESVRHQEGDLLGVEVVPGQSEPFITAVLKGGVEGGFL